MRHEQRPDGDEVNTSPEYGTDARGEDLAHAGEAPDEEYTVVDEAEELTNASDEVDSTPDRGDPEDMVVDDPQQLSEAEAVARRARSSRPQRRDGATSTADSDSPRRGAARRSDRSGADTSSGAKDLKTARRSRTSAKETNAPQRTMTTAPVRRKKAQAAKNDEHKRANPIEFCKQSVAELKKVKWLSSQDLGQYFVVVLVFVLVVIAYVSGLDVLFGWLLIKLFGQ
ncbi:preprotein translocase subunit SecE [uncultured Cutibacterium sp.]|uniref:preprotein translocase subunit SecE n=1 Tax=uncultured Cutibacterium sp. TaxID=1912223 RepID=UPI0035A707D5